MKEPRLNKVILGLVFVVTILISSDAYAHDKPVILEEIEFKDAKLMDAVRIISELSGHNIVITPDASKSRVTVFLRNISIHETIETICKINNLWYRRDPKSHSYRIMTNEEYSQDLVIHRNDKSRVFTVRGPNVSLIADAISNLYGDRVELSESGEASTLSGTGGEGGGSSGGGSGRGGSGNNGGGSRGGSNGGGGGVTADTGSVDDKLSVDQLAALSLIGRGNNIVSGAELQSLTTQKEPIYVTIVAEHNLVLVRTGDELALAGIATLIKQLNRPIPQVMLEMKVMDVLLGDDFQSVFNFQVVDSKAVGDSEAPILLGNSAALGGSFVYEFLNDRLKANIEFLEEKKRVTVLSTPMVLAANNRPARLFVGEEVVMVNGYSSVSVAAPSEVGGGFLVSSNNNVVPKTSVESVGNTIEITPYINSDGTLTLKLNQESSLVKTDAVSIAVVSGGSVLNLPVDSISTSELEGMVIAKDGLTFAVGGLVRETKSKQESRVPWFSSIPLLGKLFTSVQEVSQRSELILLVTPHIMADPGAELEIAELFETRLLENGEPSADGTPGLLCLDLCRL